MNITILDYGVGNIGSVHNALKHLGYSTHITSNPGDIDRSRVLVVPGQGAAGDAMAALQRHQLIQRLQSYIRSERPYIGICLGFQLLFDHTDEDGGVNGLGIFSGQVKRLSGPNLKVPQMGWNELLVNHDPLGLTLGLNHPITAYFANSYYALPSDRSIIFTETDYGVRFASAIQTQTVLGCQFHPEKSGQVGLHLLREFLKKHAH
ncbi:imidazole glycerol phosphate synthase subunit HisH [bacterium]|nr:imidazole glycerol phosphate synthase subunit HisH [bacterium]